MSKIKQLQNNFTTQEQSKRLLELGVPADSADMYYCRMQTKEFGRPYSIGDYATYTSISTPPCGLIFAPCWSVGRLIEILLKCSNSEAITFRKESYSIEKIIFLYENALKFDFSKLED